MVLTYLYKYMSPCSIIRKIMNKHCSLLVLCTFLALVASSPFSLDDPCAVIRCQAGYYCLAGRCLKQQVTPKKRTCAPLNMPK